LYFYPNIQLTQTFSVGLDAILSIVAIHACPVFSRQVRCRPVLYKYAAIIFTTKPYHHDVNNQQRSQCHDHAQTRIGASIVLERGRQWKILGVIENQNLARRRMQYGMNSCRHQRQTDDFYDRKESLEARKHDEQQPTIKDLIIQGFKATPKISWDKLEKQVGRWCSASTIWQWVTLHVGCIHTYYQDSLIMWQLVSRA
jgi:hypothetical protein